VAGLFITLEGIDRSGKSTQAERLCRRLRDAGYAVVATREPGGTPVAEQIRGVLLQPEEEVEPRTEALLFAAARAQHVARLIRPSLAAGKIVVCDRYIDSSIAYQARGRNLDPAAVRAWSEAATGGLWPDLTILLDLEPEAAFGRASGPDYLERRGLDYQARVRQGYLSLAQAEPERIRPVPAAAPPETVEEQIWQVVAPLVKKVDREQKALTDNLDPVTASPRRGRETGIKARAGR